MRAFVCICACLLLSLSAAAAEDEKDRNPHYNDLGFFDIHVCHWPDRPLFFMGLFSTDRFGEVAEIQLLSPSGKRVGTFNLERYRLVQQAGTAEKRVFITLFDIPAERETGWYEARIRLHDGRIVTARDRIELVSLPIAGAMQPAPNVENIALPSDLRWQAVKGASHYQVFIKDVWDGERLIHSSGLLTEPHLPLPPGLLKPGGSYLWQVHARNTNDHPVWGDFNHGSLTSEVAFSVAD